MITLSVLLLVAVVLLAVVLSILSVPVLIILGLLPWALSVAGVVLLIKAIFQQPVRWENYLPAISAFVLAGLLRWIF